MLVRRSHEQTNVPAEDHAMKMRGVFYLGGVAVLALAAGFVFAQPPAAKEPDSLPCAAEAAFLADVTTLRQHGGWARQLGASRALSDAARDALRRCAEVQGWI